MPASAVITPPKLHHAKGHDQQICAGYLRGLTDAMYVMQVLAEKGQKTFLPEDRAIGFSEAREVFENYVRSHPQSIANSAGLVAAMSLVVAHRCP